MISHTNCAHESTSGARAKCRRSRALPWPAPPLFSLGPPPGEKVKRASSRVLDDDNYGQTPSDPSKACMVCGVERISACGTEPRTQRLLYVGPKCEWYIRRSEDFKVAE